MLTAFALSRGVVSVRVKQPIRRINDLQHQAAVPVFPVASMYVICNRQGQRYTDSGFKSMWNRLQVAWHEAGCTRFHYHDLRARSVGKLKADGRQAKDITGHTTEATAERIYDRRTAKRGKAVE